MDPKAYSRYAFKGKIIDMECSIIIVTHNSERCLAENLRCLDSQSNQNFYTVIIDNHSIDPSYLECCQNRPNTFTYLSKQNLGFCQGNNFGLKYIHPDSKYILFLNPDVYLPPQFIEEALHYMKSPVYQDCGALTGILLGYNLDQQAPTGHYDSTGIFPKWYGKWYDRDRGRKFNPTRYLSCEQIPAMCGALMFCRKEALESVQNSQKDVFDRKFFMYKEDIDLSLRLIKKGWKLLLFPNLTAYHCRGWQERVNMPRHLRLLSARNELRMHFRLKSPFKIVYSLTKWAAVHFLGI